MSGEAASRTDISLPAAQKRLFDEVVKTGKPVVTVIFSGRPLLLSDIAEKSEALIQAWFPGTEGGRAVADIITGNAEPQGRLAMSFPRNMGQIPLYYNAFSTGRPMTKENSSENFFSKYIDSPNSPLYPFGYGLSYSQTEIGEVSCGVSGDKVTVTAEVKNIGERETTETVQIYIRDMFASVVRPVKQLKAFKRVRLMPGENKKIIFELGRESFSFYKEDGSCNFDDPVFAEYAEWFKHISNDLGIQPSVSELEAENANWNYYALEGYRLAMFPQGNWFTRLLNSQEDYPKDWDYGVAPLPSAGEGGNNNLVSLGYVAINKNAAHPEEALTYALWIAENQWKYEGGIPAFSTMSEEDQQLAFGSIAEASHGQVTVDDLYQNLINTGLGSVSSDIVGTAAAEYYNIVKEELSSYNMDLQDLDTAISKIVSRVNEAIANAE